MNKKVSKLLVEKSDFRFERKRLVLGMIANALDADPKPWMTPGSVEFLERNVRPTDRVVEYGGGRSSLFWAKRAAYTYTLEASPEWAPWIIQEMVKQPELLQKWSLQFTPCDWNPTVNNPKDYWKQNRINPDNAANLMDAYAVAPFIPDIFIIDGSIRPSCCKFVDNFVQTHEVRLIVVDNMETMERHTVGRFLAYERLDFHEFNEKLIPDHQEGKWCTSIFVRK